MSKTRYINTVFWSDPWVVDQLNPLDRYLFLYLLTNEHTTIAGMYEISLRTLSNETGLEKEELARMLGRLKPKVHYINGWIVLANGIKNQNYKSPKIQTGIDLVLEKCPPELIEYINWPADYGREKPEGSRQQRFLMDDINTFDDKNAKQRTKNVVRTDNMVLSEPTTFQSEKYGIDTLSHSNSNSNSNITIVSKEPVDKPGTVKTVGFKNYFGERYVEVTKLYEMLEDLVVDKHKGWYCKRFFEIGRQRVMVLAAQARADVTGTTSQKKVFNHLLKMEASKVAR